MMSYELYSNSMLKFGATNINKLLEFPFIENILELWDK